MRIYIKLLLFYISYLLHRNRDSKVIYYHDISDKYTDMGTEFELFKSHVKMIKAQGYRIVREIIHEKDEIMICFDDGWAGVFEYKDFFIKEALYPTIFIAVDLIGEEGYLSVDQIKQLMRLGFRFECHTWSHDDLTQYDEIGLEHELKDSKNRLEKVLGLSITSICYPQGRFSEKVVDMCKEFGYQKQYSSIPGGYYDLRQKGIICRNCAQFSSLREFNMMLNSTSQLFRSKLIRQHFEGSWI